MELEKFRVDLLHDDGKEDETLLIPSTSLHVLNKFTSHVTTFEPLLVFCVIRCSR